MKLTPYWLLALAMVGLGDTFFLSYYQYFNLIPSCAIGGCEIVLSSSYSHVFGVPLSYLGLVYYVYLFALSILLMIEPNSRALRLAAIAYTAVGLGLSLVFEFYIQLGLIGALCMYCGISALTTLAAFGVALWHWRTTRVGVQ